jgi:hypothetical protein
MNKSTIETLMSDRLVIHIDDDKQNPLGNVLFAIDETNFDMVWDVCFRSDTEAIFFQRLLLAGIGTIFSTMSEIGCQVTSTEVHVNAPDDSGTIIKPTTLLAEATLFPLDNHYKGRIILNKRLTNDNTEFINQVGSYFKILLEEANEISLTL